MAAVAAGMNPYATLFLATALASRLDLSLPWVGVPPSWVLTTLIVVTGVALPFDLILGKLAKPRPRSLVPDRLDRFPAADSLRSQAISRAHVRVGRVHLGCLVFWCVASVLSWGLLSAGVKLRPVILPISLLALAGHIILILLHTVLRMRVLHQALVARVHPAMVFRRIGPVMSSVAGAVLAMGLAEPAVSLLLAAAVGGGLACATGLLLMIVTSRALRSTNWAGLGHIPVLIAATATSVIIIPLGLIQAGLGLSVALLGLLGLMGGALGGQSVRLLSAPFSKKSNPDECSS